MKQIFLQIFSAVAVVLFSSVSSAEEKEVIWFYPVSSGEDNKADVSQNWPTLKTTWGPSPSEGYFDQPRTTSEAKSQGWVLMEKCGGEMFAGHRWADPEDPSLVILMDDSGFIAGVQSVLLEEDVNNSVFDPSANPAYNKGLWFNQTAWITTAYFVDPAIICNGGRPVSDWNRQGTGDRLVLQNGPTPAKNINIPQTQAEADRDPLWYQHLCFPSMGTHYIQYDYTPDQDCGVLPFQILYNNGILHGFLWLHYAHIEGPLWERTGERALRAIVKSPPTCLEEISKSPGFTTMHHFFTTNNPWLAQCPLK